MRYFGHCARYPPNRWVKFAIAGSIPGWNRGSAKKTWQKSVRRDFGRLNATWCDCHDRIRWRAVPDGKIILSKNGESATQSVQTVHSSRRTHRSEAATKNRSRIIEEV